MEVNFGASLEGFRCGFLKWKGCMSFLTNVDHWLEFNVLSAGDVL